MQRWTVPAVVAVGAVAGAWVVATRSAGAHGGLRRRFWTAFAGEPHGRLGHLGARVMTTKHRSFAAVADELGLRPDDELLDIGCGAGALLAEQGAGVRFVAGLDLSDVPLDMARHALTDRIAAGTAEVVKGDAMALPWEDGRFSAVASLDCLKFVEDPRRAFREVYRVLRPGGRAVIGLGTRIHDQARSSTVDPFGQWQWSDLDAGLLMQDAGFVDVVVSLIKAGPREQLVKGVKAPAAAAAPPAPSRP